MTNESNAAIGSATVAALADAVADRTPAPGGGAVSGAVTALAAALAVMAGRYAREATPEPTDLADLVARADHARHRALALADEDAAAYARYAAATRLPREPDSRPRTEAIRQAADHAADVPAELAEVAADVARIGARLAAAGNPRLRSDARAAVLLAAASAAIAALLVRENLRTAPGDARVATADRCSARAADLAADLAVDLAATVAPGRDPATRAHPNGAGS